MKEEKARLAQEEEEKKVRIGRGFTRNRMLSYFLGSGKGCS
jgi:hypothetical protein